MSNKNPYGICTWNDPQVCRECGLRRKLNCRWDSGASVSSLVVSLHLHGYLLFGYRNCGVSHRGLVDANRVHYLLFHVFPGF